ncbi:hypothetical protein HDU67_000214 [Dinochytrium kinnereticum]|nr:hypothetical protein HDU67_000214 [Dinochytrium kinnereticum]
MAEIEDVPSLRKDNKSESSLDQEEASNSVDRMEGSGDTETNLDSSQMDVEGLKDPVIKDETVDTDDLSGGETSDGGANSKEAKRKIPRGQDKKRGFRRTCNLLWGKLTDHRYGNVFLRALRDDKGSKCQDLIKKPMNLTIIKNRVRDEETTTFNELHRDILLMFANAIMFNNEDSDIHQMAQVMRVYAEEELQAMQSAQQLGLHQSL